MLPVNEFRNTVLLRNKTEYALLTLFPIEQSSNTPKEDTVIRKDVPIPNLYTRALTHKSLSETTVK
jgi:hypothetical protein